MGEETVDSDDAGDSYSELGRRGISGCSNFESKGIKNKVSGGGGKTERRQDSEFRQLKGRAREDISRRNQGYQSRPKAEVSGWTQIDGPFDNVEAHIQRPGSRGPWVRGKREGPIIRDRSLMARPTCWYKG